MAENRHNKTGPPKAMADQEQCNNDHYISEPSLVVWKLIQATGNSEGTATNVTGLALILLFSLLNVVCFGKK